ncbi:MAG: AAA domain-containing protein [Caldithrix sp.]|nr:AAA domain-containing protein [Caldithrix sp.]
MGNFIMQNHKPVHLITKNQQIQDIIDKIDKIAHSDSSVLLVGETGAGKEIFADYIHHTSNRRGKSFVKVGLSALPAELLESELFGHEKGAFTSAHSEKQGLFEMADKGTIFLDDIDDVPLTIQSKLLRVLESRELLRVGGTDAIPVDVRLITASKVDLKVLIDMGRFRSDLYYRINVVPLNIPPLRERREDIPLLVDYFINRYANTQDLHVTSEAMKALIAYGWPGNVRELRNVVQRLALFAEDEITDKELPQEIRHADGMAELMKACDRCFYEQSMSFDQVVSCLELNLLLKALKDSECNQSQAARLLKMSLSTFRDKLKKYELLHNNFPEHICGKP